jgi:hypothetical protein
MGRNMPELYVLLAPFAIFTQYLQDTYQILTGALKYKGSMGRGSKAPDIFNFGTGRR